MDYLITKDKTPKSHTVPELTIKLGVSHHKFQCMRSSSVPHLDDHPGGSLR